MQLNTKAGFTNEAEHSKPRVMRWVDRTQDATRNFKASIEKSGTKVILGTPVEEITLNNGAVTGVKAKGNDGVFYTIKAPAVILTTGGFGTNKDMLSGSLKNVLYYGVKSSNGDGHRMAMKIGAKTQMMDLGKIYPNGMEIVPGIAKSTITLALNAFAYTSAAGAFVLIKMPKSFARTVAPLRDSMFAAKLPEAHTDITEWVALRLLLLLSFLGRS